MATTTASSTTIFDLLCRIAGQREDGTHPTCCTCPACTVLQCLERPRYFAGQLLTDAELTGEQDYLRAKMRLHNRFLHGCGVVCGLQVSCHPCEGWVTVHEGYAIDCCGNDIVVCQDQPFDVMGAIKQCQDRDRQQRVMDCRPLRSTPDPQCQDVDQYWCLTMRYEEQETRPTTTLRGGGSPSCSCNGSCGCGGNGKRAGGCGCGSNGGRSGTRGSGGTAQMSTATTTPTATGVQRGAGLAIAACEPTSIVEGYRLEVCQAPAAFCTDLQTALDGTLLQRIATCICTLSSFLGKRIPANARTILTQAYFSPAQSLGALTRQDPAALYDACCRFRQAVYDLYVQNPLNVRCQAFSVFDQIYCPQPPTNRDVDREQYVQQVYSSIQQVATLLAQYALDCVCAALMPSCAPDPSDDRLILACMTIQDGQIVKICNWSCRRYAGSFPALTYWLSLAPVIPYLRVLIERLCCTDWIRAGDPAQNNRLSALLNSVDPTGALRANLAAGDFALPKQYMSLAGEVLGKISPAGLSQVVGPQSVNLPALVGSSLSDAQTQLTTAGVTVHEQQVGSAADVPVGAELRASPFAASGQTVTLYTAGGRIVGYGPYDPLTEVTALRDELAALREQVARMRPG